MKIQIDDVVRDATTDERDAIKMRQQDAVTVSATVEATSAAKESARTKLKALGLTDAEISALVG